MTAADFGQVLIGVAAVGSMLLSWRNGRKLEEVAHATDGMKTELVALTRKDAHREGMEEGIELVAKVNSDVKS